MSVSNHMAPKKKLAKPQNLTRSKGVASIKSACYGGPPSSSAIGQGLMTF